MRVELQNEEHCRYLRVYHYYRNLILSGQMKSETKLPSIRKGASELQMSRTTMENAYMLLAAEGYIVSRPQSGYYVTDIAEKQEEGRKIASRHVRKQENPVVYDFATSNVDKESFRFELWRRYMKSAMRQDERLLSYGEPQGEQEFREVLSEYIQKTRSVICSPDQIVIGAGTVLDPETARACILAGANYIVSPGLNVETIKLCNRYRVPMLPGVMTPSEAITAMEAGCDVIKIFPGNIVGPAAISSFKGPLPQGEFMPSGGVDVDNVDKWIHAGAYAVGTGSSLTKGAKTGDFAAVTAKAQEFVKAVAAARA